MNLAVIPLAITMNAGPQIMSAIIFVTAPTRCYSPAGTIPSSFRSSWGTPP
jgi:small neutral amino acid transporter SnatA (MarC family)